MDIEKLIRGIRSLLELLFGGTPPQWLLPGIGWLLAFCLFLLGINFVLTQIKKTWTEFLRPIFYNDKDKDRRLLRRRFADHVESEIRRLNNQENWNDYRFVELEAEIEFEGRVRLSGIFNLPGVSPSQLRRERSLSRALEKSGERLILLEGEPGSGKSIALRHLAQQLARKAMKSRNVKSVIPVYVNLREFRRSSIRNCAQGGKQPTSEEVRTFIFQTLNRVNDRDIDEFLENEFDLGMREGTWLFLFDSFDEIPDVLSSTEVDNVIRGYAGAIDDFLHGMNQCRGIVASREYRGPRRLGWPRFRVLPLSHARRVALIKHSGLEKDKNSLLIGNLALATTSFGSMIENPMFLGLLCDYVRDQTSDLLPKHTHAVFENYVVKRLARDENRLVKRYNKTPEELRAAAEVLAFAITAQPQIGLSPASEDLKLAVQKLGLPLSDDYESLLDALEFLKLARSNRGENSDAERTFSFSHRRFQEYFATCIVLQEPHRVSPQQLLTAAQWREPAVVVLQSQRDDVVKLVSDEAVKALEAFASSVESESDKQKLADNQLAIPATGGMPRGRITAHLIKKLDPVVKRVMGAEYGTDQSTGLSETHLFDRPFSWPAGLLHMLAILQDGSAGGQIVDYNLQEKVGFILDHIFQRGTVVDQKWVLEVAGVVQSEVLVKLAEIGFRSKSRWLKEAAYRQVARLRAIPGSIAKFIRQEIVNTALDRRLWQERYEVKAYISRLEQPGVFLGTLRLMLLAEPIDYLLNLAAIILVLETSLLSEPIASVLISLGLLLILMNRWHFRDQEWLAFPLVSSAGFGLLFAFPVYHIWTIGLVYAGAWGTGAIIAARDGRFTHPIWWPTYPIFAVFYLLRLIPIVAVILVVLPFGLGEMLIRLPINLYSLLKDSTSRSRLLGVLGRLALLFLAIYLVSYATSYLLTLGAPPIVALLTYIPLFLFAYWGDAQNFVRDMKRFYIWNKHKASTFGFPEFMSLVGGTKHHGIRSRIIRSMRINNLLEASPENALHLTTLLVLAENVVSLSPEKRIERFFQIFPHLQQLDRQIVSWLEDDSGLPKDFIARWNSEDMDELARLVENIKERGKQ